MNKPPREDDRNNTATTLDSRFSQTLRNVQGLLKGRSMPGKVLLSRRSEPSDNFNPKVSATFYKRSFSQNDAGTSNHPSGAVEEEVQSTSKPVSVANVSKLKISTSLVERDNLSEDIRKYTMGTRATDSARVTKFTKVLSGTVVILDKLRELAWSGVPDYMRPKVWRLLLGYEPPNSDRKEGVLSSFTTMIDGYAKAGDMAGSRFLFEQAKEKDIVAWSALISGYVQNGQPNQALAVFLEMESMNMKPDEFILVALMSAVSQLGHLDLAQWVDSYVGNSSIDLQQDHVIAALVGMNAKCGNMERALKLFREMPKRDLVSYCSMIQGFSIHGHGEDAVNLFNRMLMEGLIPDEAAFTIVLTACSHSGLVNEGWNYFNSMEENYGISPTPDHFACMVDLLSRSGHLRDAYELIKSMHVEPNAGAWGALFGACKLQGDSELGETVANRLFELEPQNAANYVLLSNIYASADRWKDVSLVRSKMKERGVRKIPGCSKL